MNFFSFVIFFFFVIFCPHIFLKSHLYPRNERQEIITIKVTKQSKILQRIGKQVTNRINSSIRLETKLTKLVEGSWELLTGRQKRKLPTDAGEGPPYPLSLNLDAFTLRGFISNTISVCHCTLFLVLYSLLLAVKCPITSAIFYSYLCTHSVYFVLLVNMNGTIFLDLSRIFVF